MTFDEMDDTYNVYFIVNESFKVVDITGRLAWKEDCFKTGFIFPEYTVEVEKGMAPFRVLMGYNKLCFRSSQYVFIVFS